MSGKSIIIIGAGISGLSAGCYGQMNGYKTRILEMHNKAGGLCTGWTRRGYTIGTTGWVWGSGPANNDIYGFWKELGALQGQKFINYEEYARLEGRDGQVLILYNEMDKLRQHMLDLAPEDKGLIEGFIKGLRAFTRYRMSHDKAPELYGTLDKARMIAQMLPYMGSLGKWMGMSLKEFASQFQNPFMREAWGEAAPNVFFFDPDISMMMILSFLAQMCLKSSGYPVGGALAFVSGIEKRYYDLGGEIKFESKVEEILVEDDQAVGVKLADGSEYRGDIVISAADGRTTVYDMLGGSYLNEEIRRHYEEMPIFPPMVLVSLGVACTFDDHPISVGGDVFPINEPIDVGGMDCKWLGVHMYNFDPTLAEEGKTRVRVMLGSDYDYWKKLREEEGKEYKAKQERIAGRVIAELEKRFPGFAEQVEMCDVATPETFERYTGNWRGSYLGWLSNPRSVTLRMSRTLPGLDSFYMIGQWIREGSVSLAAVSGRYVIQIICNKDSKQFVTSVP